MGKYSLVERRMVLPYDIIEGQNVVMGNLSCLSLFLFLYILRTTKKSVNTNFCLYKPLRITANTKCEFNRHYNRNWSHTSYPFSLRFS